MENNNPKKSKAFIIAFILILLLLLAGYYLFTNRATIFDTKGVVTMQKVFAPLLGSSKNKDLGVIGEPDTGSTTGKTITGVITTDENGNKIIQVEAGENIKKGDVLYIASFNKNNAPIVMKAIASDKNKSLVFGVAGEDMNKGAMGNIIIEGILTGVPTNRTEITAWAPNNPLYLSDKIYGGMTKNPPYAPSFIIPVGSVISIDAINGSIRVGGILNDTNITEDYKTNLNKLNSDFLNNSSGGVRDYYDSVFGINNNNKVTVDDNNNGFILNPITIPGSGSFSGNLPTVTAVASPASIVAGESSVISWISTKATVCNAGAGNGTGTTGSFKTGPLTKSKSFTITCTGANGSKSSGNTFVAVVTPSVCINKATNPPECTTIDGACINKATNPPLCTTTTIDGVCINKATNPPLCTTIDGACINKATNPPECTTIDGACINKATNPPLCTTTGEGVCLDNRANNPPSCTTTDNTCQNGSTNYPACDNILSLFPSVKVTAKPASIKEGGTTVISWTSTKAVSCDAGVGNGKGTTGSFKTGVLKTNTSYSVVCMDAKGSKGSGNVYITVSPIVAQQPECSDKIDNNENNLVDEKDPNCHEGGVITGRYMSTHYSESDPPYSANPQCSDDVDNNGNGLIDFQDPSCHIGGVLTGKYEPKHYSEDTPPFDISNTWPTIKVKATPVSIKSGGTSTISWTSTNTTSCYAGIGASTETNASFITEALSESRSYTVTCKGDKGEVSSDTYVNVSDLYKFPIVTVTATPSSIDNGGSSKISWASVNSTSCNAGTGNGTSTSGSFSTGPLTKTTSYTVTCVGPNGTSGSNVSVNVKGGTPPKGTNSGKPECSDAIDNNGNKLIDKADPNCHAGGDINATYDPTWNSESSPAPAQEVFVTTIENDCALIEKNPLVFTADEQARLAVLLRKFYLVSSTLKTTEDLSTLNNEIEQNRIFISQIEGLTGQCYSQVTPEMMIANSWVRHGNPWYKEAANVKGGTFPYTNQNTGYLDYNQLDGGGRTPAGYKVISGYYYGTLTKDVTVNNTVGKAGNSCDKFNNFPGYGLSNQINNKKDIYTGRYCAKRENENFWHAVVSIGLSLFDNSCTQIAANGAGYPGDSMVSYSNRTEDNIVQALPNQKILESGCSWKDGVILDNTERLLNIW